MVSDWGSLDRDPMCCHLPRALSKPGDPGALVGSRSVEEQLEYFYTQYARRIAPLYARQGDNQASRER